MRQTEAQQSLEGEGNTSLTSVWADLGPIKQNFQMCITGEHHNDITSQAIVKRASSYSDNLLMWQSTPKKHI